MKNKKVCSNCKQEMKLPYFLNKIEFNCENCGQDYIFKIVHSKKNWGYFLILSICYISLQFIFKNENINSILFFIYFFIILLINSFMKEIVQIEKNV
ncbi:hypothetical protein BALOs_0756 [Halobacteriovorax sp. BALOs_7]|nr:hypothetical protein BALOs_0756 [Halobacteriovorax sp. BALOs_7]